MNTLKFKTVLAGIAGLATLASTSFAQTITATGPIQGYVKVTCLPGSDTRVSVPFYRAPLFTGQITDPISLGTDALTFNLNGSTFTDNALVGTHYVKFTAGNRDGYNYEISANTSTTVTINLNGDVVSLPDDIQAGHTIIIIPHWTLDTLFPPETQTTFVESLGTFIFQRSSQILLPDSVNSGVNRPASNIYFITSAGWVEDTSENPAAGSTVILPNEGFIIRHPTGIDATEAVFHQCVDEQTTVINLYTEVGASNDNPIALKRPIPVRLSEANLLETAFVASRGHFIFERRDQLLVWDNTQTGVNRPADAIYYVVGTTWYRDDGQGSSDPVVDTEENKLFVFQPGTFVVVRKAASDGATAFLVNQPTY